MGLKQPKYVCVWWDGYWVIGDLYLCLFVTVLTFRQTCNYFLCLIVNFNLCNSVFTLKPMRTNSDESSGIHTERNHYLGLNDTGEVILFCMSGTGKYRHS